ncbi:MAG: CRISPR-associated protein Cas4 [Thermoprotei archaeon]|nr:MAG: CRISPR-associated protein Cas4 [Thermoprotei archaeon]
MLGLITDRLYIWRIEEFRERVRSKGENELWVTDLVSCPLKTKFVKQYAELAEAAAFTPVTVWGELTHRGFEDVLKILFPPEDVVTEVEVSKSVVVEGREYFIKGRVDAMYKDIVIELKTARSDYSIPHEHHILQVKLYLWITGKEKGILIYITPERIAEYEVTNDLTDDNVKELVLDVIKERKVPKYSWECKYCPYTKVCPKKVSE